MSKSKKKKKRFLYLNSRLQVEYYLVIHYIAVLHYIVMLDISFRFMHMFTSIEQKKFYFLLSFSFLAQKYDMKIEKDVIKNRKK